MDRLKRHIETGGKYKITTRDSETLEKYNLIFTLLIAGKSESLARAKVRQEYGISEPQAYKLVRDTFELYGNPLESRKEGKRIILDEMYLRAAEKAYNDGNLEAYAKILDSIAKLWGLFDQSGINIDLSGLTMPKIIVAKNDLETLRREMEAQPTDYIELEEQEDAE